VPAKLAPALRSLTRRGRSLLVAGLALAVFGWVAGVVDLQRLGVLLVTLPLLAAAVVTRTRFRVACTRTVTPPRVPVGSSAEVLLELENLSLLPTASLFAEDAVPAALGARPRFSFSQVEGGGRRAAAYSVRGAARGRHRVGPLDLRVGDPFGLVEVRRSATAVDSVVVVPVVEPLPRFSLGSAWSGSGEASGRSLASTGDDDSAVREYRRGDDLRRVHWRTTARTGEMMVRREEQPWQSRAALLLDSRSAAHRGAGPTSSWERAVGLAASVGTHLAGDGYALRAVTDDGSDLAAAEAELAAPQLLDALSAISAGGGSALTPGLRRLVGGTGGRAGVLVAVLGALSDDDVEALARGRGAATGVALLLDTTRWGDGAVAERSPSVRRAARLLATAGWRVGVLGQVDSLAAAWSEAARSTAAVDPGASPVRTDATLGVPV